MNKKINLEFYKIFNIDLIFNTDNEYLNHYNNNDEYRIICENDFYDKFPNFNLEFYKNFYKDLKDLNDYELLFHYYKNGNNENRISSENNFYNIFPNFNLEFYKNFYKDLKNLNNYQLFFHYYNYGNNENRISSENDFYNIFPNFNLEFYKIINNDLENLDDISLYKHFYYFGNIENRIYNKNIFHKIYSGFDINIYKIFNNDLKNLNDMELYKHFILYGKYENRICFSNNFDPPFYIDIYKLFNSDLNHLNNTELYKYFYLNQKYENRLYYFKENNLSFNEYIDYYNLYLNDNLLLKNIIDNNIKNYNFDYNIEYYFRLSSDNIITRSINENDNMIILLNSIINKKVEGYCIKSKKKYFCEKISYFYPNSWSHIGYHFNCSENEFIIYFVWEYNSPQLIFYPKSFETFNISYRYKRININIDMYRSYKNSKLVNYTDIKYCFGYCSNAGHHFWNEIMGLLLLIENNLINNIDEIIIGSYDYLNFAEILKNKYNKKITYSKFTETNGINISFTKNHINNNLINLFKNIYEINYNPDKNSINILFDIRTNSRVWLNQTESIINIINNLYELYKDSEIIFYVSGIYLNNNYHFDIDYNFSFNYEKEYNIQNNIFNKIQSSINNSIKIHNLIGMNLKEIIKIGEKIDILVSNTGSGIGFFYSIIYNIYSITFTNFESYHFFDQNIALNDPKNIIIIDKKNIIPDNSNFYLDFNIIIKLIINQINYLKNINLINIQ